MIRRKVHSPAVCRCVTFVSSASCQICVQCECIFLAGVCGSAQETDVHAHVMPNRHIHLHSGSKWLAQASDHSWYHGTGLVACTHVKLQGAKICIRSLCGRTHTRLASSHATNKLDSDLDGLTFVLCVQCKITHLRCERASNGEGSLLKHRGFCDGLARRVCEELKHSCQQSIKHSQTHGNSACPVLAGTPPHACSHLTSIIQVLGMRKHSGKLYCRPPAALFPNVNDSLYVFCPQL
jgi:hypothetical protein